MAQEKYAVIYADPPWSFETYSPKGKDRAADAHYKTMSLDDLSRIPLGDYATGNCMLFLWVTDPFLKHGMDLIKSWGFVYKTVGFHWVKLNPSASSETITIDDFSMGMGFWTRGNVEMCLLATKGRPKRKERGVRRLVVSPRREHSRKPDEVYERIERLSDGPYLELFSRSTRPNWIAMGEQVGLFDNGPVKTRNRPSSRKRAPASVPDAPPNGAPNGKG